ncbi:hypothetical protein BS47DRAFT_1382654, partial [Hydnum rufescens UP504]
MNQNAKSTSMTSFSSDTKFTTDTLIAYISSIGRDIRALAPPTFQSQASIPRYFKAGKAFFLYQLMLSAVSMWPEALPVALTKIRRAIERRLVLQALREPIGRYITAEGYFAIIGEMASGNIAARDEIHLYMSQLFERLLGFLAPFFIDIPSGPADTQSRSRSKNPYVTDWSNGPKDTEIHTKIPFQASTLPALSNEILIICATRADRKMQALETLGDRAVDFFYELLLLSNLISIPNNLHGRVKRIFLSNKMFSVLGPALRMHWQNALPPLTDPSAGQKIKVVADIFEAQIGAIVQRDRALLNSKNGGTRTCHESYNVIPEHQEIGKRRRDEDWDRGGQKRMRYSTSASSLSQRPPRG